MGKRQHTFLITTSTKIMSHIVAWVNQFSKASPNEMTCKFGFLLSSSSHPLQSPVHAAGERRCKWMCSRKYQPPLPSTVQVTAKRAVKFLFGLVRFSWHIIGTFKPRKKLRPHLYCIHYLHSNMSCFAPSMATSVTVMCLLIYQHLP